MLQCCLPLQAGHLKQHPANTLKILIVIFKLSLSNRKSVCTVTYVHQCHTHVKVRQSRARIANRVPYMWLAPGLAAVIQPHTATPSPGLLSLQWQEGPGDHTWTCRGWRGVESWRARRCRQSRPKGRPAAATWPPRRPAGQHRPRCDCAPCLQSSQSSSAPHRRFPSNQQTQILTNTETSQHYFWGLA